jgi:hypothetical protein
MPQKATAVSTRWTSHRKFCPKNPVTKVNGRKMVAMTVSCFMTALRRLETLER